LRSQKYPTKKAVMIAAVPSILTTQWVLILDPASRSHPRAGRKEFGISMSESNVGLL
jgi:hypothetical protein